MLTLKRFKKSVICLLAVFMLSAVSSNNLAKVAEASAVQANKEMTIAVDKNVSVQLSNVELFTQDKGLYLIYTLNFVNKNNKSISIVDYWGNIKTTKGKQYSIKVVDKDKNKRSIPAKSNESITYYAAVEEGLTLPMIQINLIKWDFNVKNYYRKIGSFNLNKGNKSLVAAFQPKTIITKETKIKTAIKSVQYATSVESKDYNITYLIENLNNRDYKATIVQFYVMTKDGSIFDASNKDLKDLTVKPKQRKMIVLNAEIPSSISTDSMKLIMGYQSETDGIFIPTASYELPKGVTSSTEVGVGQIKYNDLQIDLLGYNRLPYGSQDTLSAKIKITNKSNTYLKVPALKSNWTINGVAQETNIPTFSLYENKIQLAPGESVEGAAAINVPYTAKLSDVRITLKETISTENESIIGHFKSDKINSFQVSPDKKAEFIRAGNHINVELINVRTTENGKVTSVNGLLAVTNEELRSTVLQKLGVYMKTAEGQVFQLNVVEYENPVIANGKILVPFSGKIPTTVRTANMNLLLTELIPINDAANKELQIATNVYCFTQPWPDPSTNNKFNNMIIGKYDLSMDKVYVYLDMIDYSSIQGLNMEFEYSMISDSNYDDMAGIFKLRFEIEDQGPTKTTFVKEYTLNGKDKTDEFKEAQSVKKTISFNDPSIISKISNFKDYKLSVYYVVNEERILLAQKIIPYFNVQWMNM